MKFKYLSSDFLASYNELYEQLEMRQANLDTEFSERFSALVDREKNRLAKIAPLDFEIGEEVLLPSGKSGIIKSVEIDFNVEIDELDDHGKPLYGPGRYFPISTAAQEEIVTCEGSVRSYVVETDASEIAKDWGHSTVTEVYYAEDLKKV
jgi:hypothetical protein